MKKLKSYWHVGGDTPLIGEPTTSYLRRVALRMPDHEALVSIPQNRRFTYRELFNEVTRVAKGLLAMGVKKGDRVAIWAVDNVEWIIVQLASADIGAVLVNINPANKVVELEHALKSARVQVLFLMPAFRRSNYAQMLLSVCPELDECEPGCLTSGTLPALREVVIYDPDDITHSPRPASGFRTWIELIEASTSVGDEAHRHRTESLDADDPVNIQFTSGTTGFPKPVVLTHHNIVNNAFFVGEMLGFSQSDRLCVPVPFYHCFGMVVSNLVCLTHGSTIVIPAPHFEAGATLAAIEKEKCTAVHGVPTMFVAELERADFHTYDLSSLRTGIMAGAPCPPELVRRVIEDMGCGEILIGYGQTESSPVTHLTRPSDSFDRRVGSVGTNLPHQEVKVVDPQSGEMLPAGERGEVCFRGYHVMRGYFEMEEATHDVIDKAGWLHSGDLGVMDANGYLRITGRLKNMIIRGGENIYPAEIEAYLSTHPNIVQSAVFGVPDEKYGEAIGAWIQVRDEGAMNEDDVRAFVAAGMAHYKAPEYIRIVDEFPMTVTGKIQKFRIQEIMAEEASTRDTPKAQPQKARKQRMRKALLGT